MDEATRWALIEERVRDLPPLPADHPAAIQWANSACPVCGELQVVTAVLTQIAHIVVDHSWWERMKTRWRLRSTLRGWLARRDAAL